MRRGGNRPSKEKHGEGSACPLIDPPRLDDTERTRLIQRLPGPPPPDARGRRHLARGTNDGDRAVCHGPDENAEPDRPEDGDPDRANSPTRSQSTKRSVRHNSSTSQPLARPVDLPEPNAKEISLKAWVVESDYRYRTDGETAVQS